MNQVKEESEYHRGQKEGPYNLGKGDPDDLLPKSFQLCYS